MNHGNVSPEIAQGLLKLKQRITAANIPPSKIAESLNIATWNIREFAPPLWHGLPTVPRR